MLYSTINVTVFINLLMNTSTVGKSGWNARNFRTHMSHSKNFPIYLFVSLVRTHWVRRADVMIQVETQRTKCWCSSSDTTTQPGPGQTPNSLLNYIPIYVTFKMCGELFSLILMMCPRETIGFWVVAFVLSYKDT